MLVLIKSMPPNGYFCRENKFMTIRKKLHLSLYSFNKMLVIFQRKPQFTVC